MARIYVSSTFSDLATYREAVAQALRKLAHQPRAMEDYVASDRRPTRMCVRDVEGCDAYVGIIAWRYGYIPSDCNPDRLSITELEYRTAKRLGRPCLLFLVRDDAPWSPAQMDSHTGEGDAGARIARFRSDVQREHVVAFFSTAEELAREVTSAVATLDLAGGSELGTPVRSVPPLPELDPSIYVDRFVGREAPLGVITDAFVGLGSRAAGERVLGNAAAAKLIWVHGFGGMGKSWLLRRCALEASRAHNYLDTPVIRPCLIDYDDLHWRSPNRRQPFNIIELLAPIAERLAQQFGVEVSKAYWDAESQARAHSISHDQWKSSFRTAMGILQRAGVAWRTSAEIRAPDGSVQPSSVRELETLQATLEEHHLWSESTGVVKEREPRPLRQLEVFEGWMQRIHGRDMPVALASPERLLAEALRATLLKVTSEFPVVLILDTCELLSEELDHWLRFAVADSVAGSNHLLVIIGSRQRPDALGTPGAREGWVSRVGGGKLRVIAFDEGVLFTQQEVEDLLRRAGVVFDEDDNLPETVHRVTRGVPLAVNTLLDAHVQGFGVFAELAGTEALLDDAITEIDAVQQVIETVAHRFLSHLQHRADLTNDYQDVMALALLVRPTRSLLTALWGESANGRLKMLVRRYSILSGGDLHDSVRQFVRQRWRRDPPSQMVAVVTRLKAALDEVSAGLPLRSPGAAQYLAEQVNLDSWSNADCSVSVLRVCAILAAYEHDSSLVTGLVEELVAERKIDRAIASAAKAMLSPPYWRPESNEIPSILDSVIGAWPDEVRACGQLVAGLELVSSKRYARGLKRIEAALTFFQADPPRKQEVARAYVSAAALAVISGHMRSEAERAADWALQMEDLHDMDWHLGVLLSRLDRNDEAEKHYLKAISTNPSRDSAWHQLAHVYESNSPERAEEAFRKASDLDAYDPHNWRCWAKFQIKRGHDALAESTLRKGLEFCEDPCLIATLASHLARTAQGTEEAVQLVRRLRVEGIDDASDLNSVAWNLFVMLAHIPEHHRTEILDLSSRLAKKACSLEADDIHNLHTYACILIRQQRWEPAAPLIIQILNTDTPEQSLGEEDFYALLSSALRLEPVRAKELIRTAAGERWRLLSLAAEAFTSGTSVTLSGDATEADILLSKLRRSMEARKYG